MAVEELEKEFEPILESIVRAHQITIRYEDALSDKSLNIKAESASASFVLDVNAALHKMYKKYPEHTTSEISKVLRKLISKYQDRVVVIVRQR